MVQVIATIQYDAGFILNIDDWITVVALKILNRQVKFAALNMYDIQMLHGENTDLLMKKLRYLTTESF
ncbi:hypothetical protein [Brevibacillus nitrificans]|uniref:hypothetical protein n=1 Tax=Brevibacillus nitrificans TaxID=651560 RepID=UPI0026045561|nr:hypothetical protein [Brevibacillus nitrificans]